MQGSGSTGTVAVLVGWQLLVANVGDSCAYLDTGAEVVQVIHMLATYNSNLPCILCVGRFLLVGIALTHLALVISHQDLSGTLPPAGVRQPPLGRQQGRA